MATIILQPVMRAPVAALLALGAALAGCGGGDELCAERPAACEVAEVVEDFEASAMRRDYGRICAVLLAAEARRLAGGEECPRRLGRSAAGLRSPEIEIRRIEVTGLRARAQVTTRAAGEPEASDTIELVREDGRFRIASLSQ